MMMMLFLMGYCGTTRSLLILSPTLKARRSMYLQKAIIIGQFCEKHGNDGAILLQSKFPSPCFFARFWTLKLAPKVHPSSSHKYSTKCLHKRYILVMWNCYTWIGAPQKSMFFLRRTKAFNIDLQRAKKTNHFHIYVTCISARKKTVHQYISEPYYLCYFGTHYIL